MKFKNFETDCVAASAEDVMGFDDTAREITYKTFLKHVGREIIEEINRFSGVPIHKDWHVSFEKGKFRGKPCVCLHHSGIHHFYV